MEIIRRPHVRVPKGDCERRELVAQECRIAREHSFLSKQWVQGEFAKHLFVFATIRMFERCP